MVHSTGTTGPTTPLGRSGKARGHWVAVYALLVPAVVVPLLVPLYDQTDPALFGFPFYYWFQFALIPFAAVLTTAAYLVARSAERADRAARGLEPPRDDVPPDDRTGDRPAGGAR